MYYFLLNNNGLIMGYKPEGSGSGLSDLCVCVCKKTSFKFAKLKSKIRKWWQLLDVPNAWSRGLCYVTYNNLSLRVVVSKTGQERTE